jgi:hypothetical protein
LGSVKIPFPLRRLVARFLWLAPQRALVHFDVMQDEVFRVQELTLEPEAGAGIGADIYEMRPADPTLPDGACPKALVEARERVLDGEGAGECSPE